MKWYGIIPYRQDGKAFLGVVAEPVAAASLESAGVSAITYGGPLGEEVRNPSPDFLERLIFRERGRHWLVGNGSSGLSVMEKKGRDWQAVPDEPALMFYLVERHGFFFVYFDNTGRWQEQYVPLAGASGPPWVEHTVGAMPFYAPRGSFVSRPFAWEIVREFTDTRRRSKAVRWVRRRSLRLPDPEENPPRRAELA